jgi:hypothetical protein
MKMANYTAGLAIALTALAGQSWAGDATLAQAASINGTVAVTRAGQTMPLTTATVLQAGDRVVAMENGQAQVRFADGCVMQVQSKSVATVGGQSPCAASRLVKSSSPMDFADSDTWAVPIAIVGFAGAFALIVSTEKSNGEVPRPISP